MNTRGLLTAVLCLLLVACSRKQVPMNLWYEPVDKLACPGKVFPLKYHTYRVDYTPLRKLLLENTAPKGSHDTLMLAIPYPDGTHQQFSVFPVHVMPDELAQKYPGIATYTGTKVNSPAETIRLDISPAGFRAMVMSFDGTMFIDPYCTGDSIHVISYYKKDMPEGSKAPFEEVIPGDHQR